MLLLPNEARALREFSLLIEFKDDAQLLREAQTSGFGSEQWQAARRRCYELAEELLKVRNGKH